MNILYFYWGENSCDDMIQTLLSLGHTVHKISVAVTDYFENPQAAELIRQQNLIYRYEILFSFNYFPFLSDIALDNHLLYVSWIYDCPHWTLFSKNISNECNRLFLFDRNMAQVTKNSGAKYAHHLPLAVHTQRLNSQLSLTGNPAKSYTNDISFVGSLYENNHYNHLNYLPEYLHGYLDSIIASQRQLWDCNLVQKLLIPEIIQEMENYIKPEISPKCPIPIPELFQNMLLQKVTSEERIEYLNTLSKIAEVSLYTASAPELCPNAIYKGTVSYLAEMPEVFCHSKININITLRSITSGIPLRAIDILGCQGFLLTNYQTELSEWLVPNVDFVYYEDLYDLAAKAQYYLAHDREREAIACSGWHKIQNLFSYPVQVQKLLQLC